MLINRSKIVEQYRRVICQKETSYFFVTLQKSDIDHIYWPVIWLKISLVAESDHQKKKVRYNRDNPQRISQSINMHNKPTAQTLIERTSATIRQKIIRGELTPGTRLCETALSEQLHISRNTLREVFRLLTQEGLLRHEANRGVQVSQPDTAAIMDIYRVRRLLECDALLHAYPLHPAVARMQLAVDNARKQQQQQDWQQVGTENIAFHSAIIELTDSERLMRLYRHIAAELRLAFSYLQNAELLHQPYIEKNASILALLNNRQNTRAARDMDAYLRQSERTVLAALARQQAADR